MEQNLDKIELAETEAYYQALRNAGCDVDGLEQRVATRLQKRSANGDATKEFPLRNRMLLEELKREADHLGIKVTLPMIPGTFSR